MRIGYDELLIGGRFKSFDELEEILQKSKSEPIFISGVPHLECKKLDCSLIRLNTLARSKQEYLLEEVSGTVVFGIVLRVKNVDTGLIGLYYLTNTEVNRILEEEYTNVYTLGYKIFIGVRDNGDTVQILDNTFEYLNFTEYNAFDILTLANFKFIAYTPGDLKDTQFIMVEVYEEEAPEGGIADKDPVDYFTLRDEKEVISFFDTLKRVLNNLLDAKEIESLERNCQEIQYMLR